jgi:protein subunit release factor A
MKRKESIILEIRAGEGGSDAKLLVKDTLNIYLKSARNQSFESKLQEEREGFASI